MLSVLIVIKRIRLCYNLAVFFLVSFSSLKGSVGLFPTAVERYSLPFACVVGGGYAEEPVKQLRPAACGVNSRALARHPPRRGPANGVYAPLARAGRSPRRKARLPPDPTPQGPFTGL